MSPRTWFMAAICVVLATIPATTAQVRTQAYEGAARIGNLDAVTVVYPAATGLEGRIRRDSADLKASYLTRRYGTVAHVVADNEISDRQLEGHLLVLGWENELIGTEKAPRPWRRNAEGLNFLGVTGAEATDDLLFMCASPYNPERFLVFWSRIDPLLERFLTFPFVGSDWAIYRDYFILSQGMFDSLDSWPPARNVYAERDQRMILPPKAGEGGHYELFYDPGLMTGETADRILAAREEALETAAKWLGFAPPADLRIRLYVYADQQRKHERTGVADAVHSLPERGVLYMPVRHARIPNPHEEVHLLAAARFGPCYLSAMYEGLALYLETRDNPARMDSWAALMTDNEVFPKISELVDDESLRQLQSSRLAFPASALLIRWLIETAGADALDQIYSSPRAESIGVIRKLAEVPEGASADEAFETWIRKKAVTGASELAFRKTMARGDERVRVGDFVGASAAFAEALEIKPDDSWLVYRLALCRLEIAEYGPASEGFEHLLALTPAPEPSWLRIFSQLQVAKIADLQGNRDDALSGYRAVLAMQDELDAHRRAREALELLGVKGE